MMIGDTRCDKFADEKEEDDSVINKNGASVNC